jgi:hypothetical protein
MSLRSIVRAWNDFFFTPQSPVPVALFRIVYGLLVSANLILMRPDWLAWFGPRGWVSMETMHRTEPGTRINIFSLIPADDSWVHAVFWLGLAAAILLTVGWLTRASSVALFIILTSLDQRNLYILHSGDTLLRVLGFFLMFAPAGAALSVDRLVRIWRGKETAAIEPRAPWAQRMIQIQTALTYFTTAYWKTLGSDWIDGTALHYVFRLEDFRRFPLPSWVRTLAFEKLATWGTLAVEFALGTLVWIRELRYPILLTGLVLHLSLEYSMNVPLFQWVILSTYVTFVYPEDLTRAWAWIRGRVAPHLGEPATVVYDGGSLRMTRRADLLRAIDVFKRLNVVDLRAGVEKHGIGTKGGRNRLLVLSPWGALEGFDGLRFVASRVPLLWPLAPAALFTQPRQLASAERAAK